MESVWTGSDRYAPYALANVVPEIDQFKLGTYLVPLDPHVDRAQSRRVRQVFLDVYREMRTDPTFVSLGSAMPVAYRDLFLGAAESGHLYVVRPAHPRRETLPTAVFLHGSLGPFKGYTWVLRTLADRCDMAVVAPTYGAGFWYRPGGARVVDQAVAWVATQPDLASPRTLIGLSAGGFGVTRAALHAPDQWDHLVYLTGIVEPGLVAEVGRVVGGPVTVIWAEQDRRIPAAHTRAGVAALRDGGAEVTSLSWPDEDHFLFFSDPDGVVTALARQLPECGAEPDRPRIEAGVAPRGRDQ